MAVPTSIRAEVVLLVAAVTAAAPLRNASRILIAALQRQGAQTLSDIEGALASAAGALDADDPSGFPDDFAGTLVGLQVASVDQAALSDMRGLIGRAMFNISQAAA